MRGEQHGDAAVADALDERPEVAARLRVETRCRLVEKDDARLVHERDGDREPLTLAAGELLLTLARPVREVHLPEERQRVDRAVVEDPEELDDLLRRVVLGERARLELHADTALDPGRIAGHVDAGDRGGTGVRVAQPFEDLDRRRLPSPVRTEEPEDLAFRHREADAADGLDLTVPLAKVGHGDDRRRQCTKAP